LWILASTKSLRDIEIPPSLLVLFLHDTRWAVFQLCSRSTKNRFLGKVLSPGRQKYALGKKTAATGHKPGVWSRSAKDELWQISPLRSATIVCLSVQRLAGGPWVDHRSYFPSNLTPMPIVKNAFINIKKAKP
tara:strand:- start:3709 stop:4107 length:399 start_codon:yes stop_codon:yes gene_type:complete